MIKTVTVANKSKQSIEWLARGSYVAKAILYGAIGLFAFN